LRFGFPENPLGTAEADVLSFPASFAAITREQLKVRRQVKHWKKGFRKIFQMNLTKRYVSIWNYWLFFIIFNEKIDFFDHFQEKFVKLTF